jgi:hypothetical protein
LKIGDLMVNILGSLVGNENENMRMAAMIAWSFLNPETLQERRAHFGRAVEVVMKSGNEGQAFGQE